MIEWTLKFTLTKNFASEMVLLLVYPSHALKINIKQVLCNNIDRQTADTYIHCLLQSFESKTKRRETRN